MLKLKIGWVDHNGHLFEDYMVFERGKAKNKIILFAYFNHVNYFSEISILEETDFTEVDKQLKFYESSPDPDWEVKEAVRDTIDWRKRIEADLVDVRKFFDYLISLGSRYTEKFSNPLPNGEVKETDLILKDKESTD